MSTPGFLAAADLNINTIEERRLALIRVNRRILDLTESNPTKAGLMFPEDVLRRMSADYFTSRRYAPCPRGLSAAREAICRYYADRVPAFSVTPEQVFITAGTSESYRLLFSILADPGESVLAPGAGYPLIELIAEDARLKLEHYELDEDSGWQISTRDLKEKLKLRPRALLLVSPHNPTGTVISGPAESVSCSGVPIVCDEVFCEHTAGVAAPPLATFYPDNPVFLLNGISKMFALPDLKLGWIVMNTAAQDQYAKRLEILNDSYLSCSSLIQAGLPLIFKEGRHFLQNLKRTMQKRLDAALGLIKLCRGCTAHRPAAGATIVIALDVPICEEELVLLLLEKGVYFHPGYFYGIHRGTHLVFSCISEPTVVEEGLAILRQSLQDL